MEEESGLTDFSGSGTDKEFWIVECCNMEKEFLKKKAHQKSLALVTQSSSWASKGPNPSGEHGKSARSKHNAKQRKLYKKHLKARRAEQRKLASAPTTAPAATAASKGQ